MNPSLFPVTHETVPVPAAVAKSSAEGLLSVAVVGVWWGLFAGMVEGIGLLLFQRINWERWGAMTHVTHQILCISPVVDVLLFAVISGLVALGAGLQGRIPALRVVVPVLVFLSVYDWLKLTERLTQLACIMVAVGCAVAFGRWFKRNRPSTVAFWRNTLPWLLAIWVAMVVGFRVGANLREHRELASLPAAAAGAPNVLVIVVDTLRADHLSTYGYSRPTTPNFDRISKQGVLFENAISASSWTLPSHASLLTGRYPSVHGLQNVQPMPWLGWGNLTLNGLPTFGEALEHIGYRTGAFSANQLYFTSNVGLGRGFIRFEDYYQSFWDMFLRTLYGRDFDRNYLHRTEKSKVTRSLRAFGLAKLLDDRKRADEVNREALAWIDKGHQPFLAVLNYIDVHDASSLQWIDRAAAFGRNTEVDQYDSAVNYVDREFGNLIAQLERRGLASNTLVVITSDHGEGLGQHQTHFHGIALYRETIHVPLLVYYPGRIPTSARVTRPVSNAAIAATIMDLVGMRGKIFPDPGLDQLWAGVANAASWPDPISELQKNGIDDRDGQASQVEPTAMDGDMKSLITPRWHFIVHQKLGWQLYDWVHDPGETQNLINTPEGQRAAGVLFQEMQMQSAP